jgi:hypothetical protein
MEVKKRIMVAKLDSQCTDCNRSFTTVEELSEHRKIMHKGTIHTGREEGRRKPVET